MPDEPTLVEQPAEFRFELSAMDVVVQRITEIAPKLEEQDVKDLITIAARGDAGRSKLESILRDYKAAKVLNKSTAKKVLDFLNGLKPLFDLGRAIADVIL